MHTQNSYTHVFSSSFRNLWRARRFFRGTAQTLVALVAAMLSGLAWGSPVQPNNNYEISIAQGEGQITLTWTDTSPHLETAYQLEGPWYAVPDAYSPYTVSSTSQQQYFRLNYTTLNSNTLPIAVSDTFTTQEDQSLTVDAPGVLANDSESLGEPLLARLVTGSTSGGEITLNPDGSFTYVPPAGFLGEDSFTYVALAESGQSLPAVVYINVTETAPVAVNDSYAVHMNTSLDVSAPGVLGNDYDPDGYAIEVVPPQLAGPANGQLFLNWDGSFIYTPNSGFTGTDSFTYQIADLFAESQPATVTLNVQSSETAPVAGPGTYAIAHDNNLVAAAPGVLAYASDAAGYLLTASLVTESTNGVVALSGNGSFTYYSTPGFVGMDSFVYMVNDGVANSSPATITINVTNGVPVANPDFYTTHPGETLTVSDPGVLLNDSDPDNDSLTAQLVSEPVSGGTLSLDTNGGFVYTPPPGFTGVDTFTYSAWDGITSSSPAVVTINVTNSPPVAANYSYGVQMNLDLTVPAPGVLLNSSDPDGDSLTATMVVTPPAHGTVQLSTNGSFTYEPALDYVGPDGFTYIVNDGYADSAPGMVNLMVHATNTAPTTTSVTYYLPPSSTLLPPAPYLTDPFTGILTVDSDAENDELTAILVRGPKYAQSFTLNSDGTFSYLPLTNFVGVDKFVYQAFDGLGYSTNTVVYLNVHYDPPTVLNSSYTVHFNTLLSDPEPGVLGDVGLNDNSSVQIMALANDSTVASHGTVSLQTNGSFTYQPAANFVGNDSFQYLVYDGITYQPATVNITVTDTAPVAVADTYYDAVGGSLSVDAPGVLTNDYDADYDSLSAVLITSPANASQFALHADGSFFYVPQSGFNGVDTFTYAASDGALLSQPATVTINVSSVPVGVNDVYVYTPGLSLTATATNGVLENDFDPASGGPGLTAQLVPGSLTGGTLAYFNSDGSFSFVPPAGPSNPPITFEYKAYDASLGSFSAPTLVTLLVMAGPEAPAGPVVPAGPAAVKLVSVTFSGGTDVLPDDSGKFNAPFSKPHWTSGGTANPYSYVISAPMTIDAEVKTAGGLKGGTLTGTLYMSGAVDPTSKIGTVSKTFDKTDTPQFLGATAVKLAPGTVAELLLPDTYKYDTLLIDWTYTSATGGVQDCGQSKNIIYLTSAKPVEPGKTMFQTVLEIANKASSSKRVASVLSADGGVWKYFVSRNVQLLSPPKPKDLTYYSDWFTRNCILYQLLAKNDAQCMTFAELLTAVYRTQGITDGDAAPAPAQYAVIVKAKPIAGKPDGFLVKTWTPAPKATSPYFNESSHTVAVGLDRYYNPRAGAAGAGMYSWDPPAAGGINPEFIYGGGTGQNNASPAANFNCHFIVKVVNGANTTYFDPSYGNTYTGANSMESTAVAGYYKGKAIGGGVFQWTIDPVNAANNKWLEFVPITASF